VISDFFQGLAAVQFMFRHVVDFIRTLLGIMSCKYFCVSISDPGPLGWLDGSEKQSGNLDPYAKMSEKRKRITEVL
jgi:hypothetical protein